MLNISCFAGIRIFLNINGKELLIDDTLIWGFSLFAGFSVLLILLLVSRAKKARRCSVEVESKINAILTNNSGTVTVYTPEYIYRYMGREYKVCSKTYSSNIPYKYGEIVPLRIDPDHPEEFLDTNLDSGRAVLLAVILGIVAAVGFFIICYALSRQF
ncbi:MAG: hypothetical protein J6Z45_00055 [Oscillospiraceae bacterium]|nr:hypothetical protein [Oscillospiraceae bacterium]